MADLTIKDFIIAVLVGVALGAIFFFAPSENCHKVVACEGETLACSSCGRNVPETFDGLCDVCAVR